jgi:hypothetical protein
MKRLLFGIVFAAVLPSLPASAQTIGAASVTIMKTFCEAYLAGAPYHETLLAAGFSYDAQEQEY